MSFLRFVDLSLVFDLLFLGVDDLSLVSDDCSFAVLVLHWFLMIVLWLCFCFMGVSTTLAPQDGSGYLGGLAFLGRKRGGV